MVLVTHLAIQTICISVILFIFCTSGAFGGPGLSKSKGQSGLPKGKKCGISPSAAKGGRIVGGEEAVPHSWPWQVLTLCLRTGLPSKYGGGSLISDIWVMTAGHSLVSTVFDIKKDCRMLLGKHKSQVFEPTQVNAEIDKFFVHEKYNSTNPHFGFDIGLVKLTKSVNFTNAIRPICLPFGRPELTVGATCYVSGWGRTIYNVSKSSPVLKQLSMPVQEERYCQNFTRDAPGRVICTGLWNRKEDACLGDSGGPLSCQESDRNWYLRGVITRGNPTCDSITVSTKVTAFQEWIENIIARN